MNKRNYELKIAWLYPELMSTYGDRGNIIILEKRCGWRNIAVRTEKISFDTPQEVLSGCDIVFGGGAQDRQQEIVVRDMGKHKHDALLRLFDRGVPGLFVCGSFQLFGGNYTTAEGARLSGLGILPMHTKHPGPKTARLIGNTVYALPPSSIMSHQRSNYVVGFENHGGRTYLDNPQDAFARVVYGHGNNGRDKTEGIVYKNVIATYSHGPLLSKNPHIADWLICMALKVKYSKNIRLEALDDSREWEAHEAIVSKYIDRK